MPEYSTLRGGRHEHRRMESLAFSISATSRMGGLGEYRVRMGTVGKVGGLGALDAMDAIDVKGVYLQLGLGASSWWQSKCKRRLSTATTDA